MTKERGIEGVFGGIGQHELNLRCHTVCRDYGNAFSFRPLTKNGYRRDGIVTVLQKGRELFPEKRPLISVATHGQGRNRVLQVSRVCMWMEKCGIPIRDRLPDTEEPAFIPSACWRKIARGILSTTRFAGVLAAHGKLYAVYDIGDGTMDWQLRAESSLF